MKYLRLIVILMGIGVCCSATQASAQGGTPVNLACPARLRLIYIPEDTCLELLVSDLDSAAGLTFDSDGVLYVSVPTRFQVVAYTVEHADVLSEPRVIATLPEPPVGIAFDDQSGDLLVSADTTIYRLSRAESDQTWIAQAIVQGLPGGAGGWLGNLRIGADARLYVVKAVRCLYPSVDCIEDDTRRGALLSFALDGSTPRVFATGLRDSFDMAWTPDRTLYLLDNPVAPSPAELNRITLDRIQQIINGAAPVDFAAEPPLFSFDPGSQPRGLLFYMGGTDGLNAYAPGLIATFGGAENYTVLTGYEMFYMAWDADAATLGAPVRVIPATDRTSSNASLVQTTFYPYRLMGITTDAHGWIYLTQREGRILRWRPAVKP